MKKILREEINRTKELMGVIVESEILLEKELTSQQKRKLSSCAIFGGSFWCVSGADECADMLESGVDDTCTGGGNVVNTNTDVDDLMVIDKKTVNEELLTEDQKFRKHLEACRSEVANGAENSEDATGGGKKCKKFFRKYG